MKWSPQSPLDHYHWYTLPTNYVYLDIFADKFSIPFLLHPVLASLDQRISARRPGNCSNSSSWEEIVYLSFIRIIILECISFYLSLYIEWYFQCSALWFVRGLYCLKNEQKCIIRAKPRAFTSKTSRLRVFFNGFKIFDIDKLILAIMLRFEAILV